MWIAIDTASGDHGPEPIVHGAIMATKELHANIILVGDEARLKPILDGHPHNEKQITIEHCTEVISMDEQPAKAVRSKKNASVVVAANLVKEKRAIGFFSPGNTGASMAAAMMTLGRLPGVKRPTIVTPIPRPDMGTTVLLDAGANVDCKPEYLVHSALMGEIYSREIIRVINPKIGLLSNGEESNKGNELTLKTFDKLKKLPINFIGNVEGRDIFGDGKPVDVVVTDGFTGNIVVKTIEGTAKAIFNILKTNIKESQLAKTGALLLKPTMQAVKAQMDHSSYGGAPLLGIAGIAIIGHGSSNAWAVRNAIKLTQNFAKYQINELIQDSIDQFS